MVRIGTFVLASLFAVGCAHRPAAKADQAPTRHVDVNRAIDESQRKTGEVQRSPTSEERSDSKGGAVQGTPATAPTPVSPPTPPPKP